ncbi:polysaccharide deacetylase family protein [Desulfurispora thermophila]|uniref:polysaccharide deacetylase family protein n=1 Tax=Desulfurispora thermophila TaxID=265470 RepID=UPI00037C189D|nr:polysaccharide deacetylase family protein [Desulfurispora thermophila]
MLLALVSLVFMAAAVAHVVYHDARYKLTLALFEAYPPAAAEGKSGPRPVPVLMYHKVNPDPRTGGLGLRVPPDKFAWQMDFLASHGYHTVSLLDVLAAWQGQKKLPSRPVVITFDDGYLDNYTYALPILRQHGFTATVFVVAGTVGGINSFDYPVRQPRNVMMGWDEIKKMQQAGITIGSHTLNHPHLADLTADQQAYQLRRSKEILEEHLGRPVDVLCYPYGSYNEETLRQAAAAGYWVAVTTVQGLAVPADAPYRLKRIRIRGDYSRDKFVHELLRYY